MTFINETARFAVESDITVLTDLVAEAAKEKVSVRGGSVWSRLEARREPVAESLSDDLNSDEACLVVGTIDTAIVGFASARLVTLHDSALLGRVDEIYVMPEARGVGVGEAMMGLLLNWARQHHCIGVDSLALPGDRNTKNFFETHGLVARSITVHRVLTDEITPCRDDPQS